MKKPPEATPAMLAEAQRRPVDWAEARRRFDDWLAAQPLSLSSVEIALIMPAWLSGFLDGRRGHHHPVGKSLGSELERDAFAAGYRAAI
jgi:hypothetical protein